MSNPKIFLQPELIEGDNIDIAQDGKTISSNTPLENITDTEITEVEDGQALIYDETSGKWVNGEGGTPIEPNPAAAATDTLSTIKIDNTVFTIGGGGTGDAVLYPLTTAEYNALTPEQKMDENVLYLLTDGGSGGGGGGGTGGGFYAPDYENPETITLTPLTWVTYNVTQNGYVMVDLTAFTETGGTSVKVNGTTLNFDKVDGTNYILNSTYMFPVMANDVVEIRLNYDGSGYGSNTALFFPAKSGGGGGSKVVPNPEDEATDVLHSIKIDDATYAIQGGGSFIDVENRIVAPTEFTTSLTYTATEDCVVCMYLVCPGDASTFVKINDFTVQNFWQAELATGPCAPIFVRAGQTLTVTGAHTTYTSNYIVYGVQSSGGGGGTGNLNAVEMDYEDWLALPQEEREDPDIEYFLSNAPGGGGGLNVTVTKILDQHIETTGEFSLDGSIDNYDALLIGGYNYVSNSYSNQYKTTLILKEDYYKNTSNHADHILGNMTASTSGDNPRRVIFYFPDDTHINIQTRNFASIDKIFGLKFEQSGSGATFEGLDYSNATDLTLPDNTGYTYTPSEDGVIMVTAYGNVGALSIQQDNFEAIHLAHGSDRWTTAWCFVEKGVNYTLSSTSRSNSWPSGSWAKFIPLKQSSSGGGSSEVKYSTDEQKIGTWIDGKPLYQKTLFFNNVEITMDNSTSEAVHGIDDIEMGWVEEVLFKDTSGVNSWVSVKNTIAWTASSTMQNILWRVGNRSIYAHFYPTNSITKKEARSFYITIHYTKTTD